jgi:hypothetical protein
MLELELKNLPYLNLKLKTTWLVDLILELELKKPTWLVNLIFELGDHL